MKKYDPENERVKRDYAFFLEAANGKQDASIDAALRAIERFENSTRSPSENFASNRRAPSVPGLWMRQGRTESP